MNFLITCNPDDQTRATREVRAAGHEPYFKGDLVDEIEISHVKKHGEIRSGGDRNYNFFGWAKCLASTILEMAEIFPDSDYL